MKLTTAITQFIQDLRLEASWATCVAYEGDLHRLLEVTEANSVLAFTPETVRKYFLRESSKGNGMNTLHRRRAALNQFAKWGLRKRYWASDPMVDAPKLKLQKRLPRPFSQAQRRQLLALELPLRDRLLRALLYYTGVRVTPLSRIRLADIAYDDTGRPHRIRTIGKGNKEHWSYVQPELADVLLDYTLQKTDLVPGSFLLARRDGKSMTRKQIGKRTAAWGQMIDPPVMKSTPHRWRHSFGTELLERKVDIRKIQKLMGHADISTTMLYTEVTDLELDEAAMMLSDRKRDIQP